MADATFVAVAVTPTAPPGALTLELESTRASVSAVAEMRASAMLTAMAPSPPIETMIMSLVAELWLIAETVTPAAPAVRLPSTLARVAPASSAIGTETATPKRAPPAPMPVFIDAVSVDVAEKLIAPERGDLLVVVGVGRGRLDDCGSTELARSRHSPRCPRGPLRRR